MIERKSTQLVSDNYIGHLAYISGGVPFIAPITYYYDKKENVIISYSNEGHKINAMRLNNSVSVMIGDIQSLNNWKSVLLIGDFEELNGSEAKLHLHNFAQNVKGIIAKKGDKDSEIVNVFSEKLNPSSIPIVYRIKVHEIIGREKN